MHAGEPVTAGEKWVGAAWMWEPFLDRGKVYEAEDAVYRTAFLPSLFDRVSGEPLPVSEAADARIKPEL
jgi:hypothetical protein